MGQESGNSSFSEGTSNKNDVLAVEELTKVVGGRDIRNFLSDNLLELVFGSGEGTE